MVIPLKDYMLTICLLFKCHMYFPGEDIIEILVNESALVLLTKLSSSLTSLFFGLIIVC